MDNKLMTNLIKGSQTAFYDKTIESASMYRPQFLSNDAHSGRKVLSTIEGDLSTCEEFIISVAFITMSGLTPLLQTLKELQIAGKKGKVLTTDYLCFSEPKALDKIASFENIELRMFCTENNSEGFHTKGYIFRNKEIYTIITGSSNITLGALTRNKEWNSRIVSTKQGEYANKILSEFAVLWNAENTVSYADLKEFYKTKYELVKEQKKIASQQQPLSIQQYKLQPNDMQIHFVRNLRELRSTGKKRALLISATGTGKTYASAFALRDANPKKVLFLVHREIIAKQAIASYKKVFGNTKTFGLLSGSSREIDADYLFCTMQMMAKEEVRNYFSKNEFEIIVIDEVHRAGANSYKKIMEYFTPDFWLGMTASPERTDGFDIYALFDHNIAYEIRLQKAMEYDMLCPFHYFGISDLEIDGKTIDDISGIRDFNFLVSDSRVEHIIAQLMYYGYSGERPKGLVFCSRNEEAKELSDKFNQRGFKTIALSGATSPDKREEAIHKLTSNDTEDYLDYIFTVDIFNEGVDIPDVNQVVMLRPTESPVVFVQQLGRGLRKATEKEYVVILDFIGNYLNNFMIPIALSGDRSYNKDTIRRYVREGTKVIPGSSTIHFDEISRKRIYASIDQLSTTKALLVEKYMSLRQKLGRVPTICEFYYYSEIDPLLFIDYAGSYHNFLMKIKSKEPDYNAKLSIAENNILDFVSGLLANGKRPHELIILSLLMKHKTVKISVFEEELRKLGIAFKEESLTSACKLLCGEFVNTQSEKQKYSSIGLVEYAQDELRIGNKLDVALQNSAFVMHLEDVVTFGLLRFNDIYAKDIDETGLSLYHKYSRKDVCRLLNWERDDSATIYGYRIKYNTCPIFVTYEKQDDISESTKYPDEFLSTKVFSWFTRNRVSISHPEAQSIINSANNDMKVMLFVKKSDGEGSDFYYMGQVRPAKWKETTIKDKNGVELPIMNFQFDMVNEVRDDIFDYLTA